MGRMRGCEEGEDGTERMTIEQMRVVVENCKKL